MANEQQNGRYTIITIDDRIIKLDTQTGEAWTLIRIDVDWESDRWQRIVAGEETTVTWETLFDALETTHRFTMPGKAPIRAWLQEVQNRQEEDDE